VRLTRILLSCAFVCAAAPPGLRAEYVALRSGQRLHVTGYQLIGETYRLQVDGGTVEVPTAEVVSIEPEDAFAPLPPAPAVAAAPYGELVKAAAARYSVDADLISSVIAAESNFDAKAVSRRNARGLMQLLPETAAHFGVQNIFDPQENIDAGTHYLRDLLQRYNNDLALALAAYNAGPERVEQFGRVPPYAETVSYIRRVKRAYDRSKSGASTGAAANPSSKKGAPVAQRNPRGDTIHDQLEHFH
jgi:soluble lytic murein transglycosylase-like protein